MGKSLNYYKLLGVPSSATEDEIRTAYRSQIMQYHHDKTPGDQSDICYDIIEAYRILSNRNSRKKYDIERDKSNRPLSDAELIEKYKSKLSKDDQKLIEITPQLLLKLRQEHSAQRIANMEPFVPLKAICYNLDNLLSTQFKRDILRWQHEFNDTSFQDNFFESYQNVMEQIDLPEKSSKHEPYFCDLCQKNFTSYPRHTETVLNPYLTYLGVSNCSKRPGISELFNFFEDAIGLWFEWEPPIIEPDSIWETVQSINIAQICAEVNKFVLELPDPEHFPNVEEHITYIQKCTWADASIVYYVAWTLEHSDIEELTNHALDMFKVANDDKDLEELYIYIGVLIEFLGFDAYDLSKIRQSALETQQFEMSLLCTLVMVEMGMKPPEELIHFIFSSGIYQSNKFDYCNIFFRIANFNYCVNHEVICDKIFEHGDYLSAIHYILQFCELSMLMSKYLDLSDTNPEDARIYKTAYYSRKLKSILRIIEAGTEDRLEELLEEVVEISQLLFENPFEAYRAILKSFPERLSDPEFYAIHYWVIQNFASGKFEINEQTFQLILAGWHFLAPENEVDEDFLMEHSRNFFSTKLRQSLDACDFEALTEVLLDMSFRNVPAAQDFLEEICAGTEMSNHLKAIQNMITGSVHKLHKNWLAAISEYLDALLNAPEINYRLTPCVSKLSQDFELHDGILDEVRQKLDELKNCFRVGKYITFEEDAVSSPNSLVVSHPKPKHEFKYCEHASKIQCEPPKTQSEPNVTEDLTQVSEPANTPNVTLESCERAIETGNEGKALGPLDAAFAYLDLLESLPLKMHHGSIIMAASHFLRAIETAEDLNCAFSYKKAITALAHRLIGLDSTNQARVQSCLTHKHMFSILLSADQCLSKWCQPNVKTTRSTGPNLEESESSEFESSINCDEFWTDNKESQGEFQQIREEFLSESPKETFEDEETEKLNGEADEAKLISDTEKFVISKLLKSVVDFSKVEPLLNIPCLTSSDLGYVEKVKTQFLQQFCIDAIARKEDSVHCSAADQALTLFLEVLHGRTQTISFEIAKQALIESILYENKMTVGNLLRFIEWPFAQNRSNSIDDGWADSSSNLLHFRQELRTFESIEGFKINGTTGEISFLLKPAGREIFSTQDMFEIFQNNLVKTRFKISDDNITNIEPNPFQSVYFEPCSLAGTDYLKTILRISRLMTTLTTGMEVNSNPPFLAQEVEIRLLEKLPSHLQYFLRPLRERAGTLCNKKATSETHSFLLSLNNAYFEENQESEDLIFTIGDLELELSCSEDSEALVSLDSNHNEELSPTESFVQDFNRNCQELGGHFPEFQRIRELGKISLICLKFQEILKSESYSTLVKSAIYSLGLPSEDEPEDFQSELIEECKFIPSPKCHSHTNVIDASTGVCVEPKLIYGPVSPSKLSQFITVQELLTPKEALQIDEEIMYEVSSSVTVYLRREYAEYVDNGAKFEEEADDEFADDSLEIDDVSNEDTPIEPQPITSDTSKLFFETCSSAVISVGDKKYSFSDGLNEGIFTASEDLANSIWPEIRNEDSPTCEGNFAEQEQESLSEIIGHTASEEISDEALKANTLISSEISEALNSIELEFLKQVDSQPTKTSDEANPVKSEFLDEENSLSSEISGEANSIESDLDFLDEESSLSSEILEEPNHVELEFLKPENLLLSKTSHHAIPVESEFLDEENSLSSEVLDEANPVEFKFLKQENILLSKTSHHAIPVESEFLDEETSLSSLVLDEANPVESEVSNEESSISSVTSDEANPVETEIVDEEDLLSTKTSDEANQVESEFLGKRNSESTEILVIQGSNVSEILDIIRIVPEILDQETSDASEILNCESLISTEILDEATSLSSEIFDEDISIFSEVLDEAGSPSEEASGEENGVSEESCESSSEESIDSCLKNNFSKKDDSQEPGTQMVKESGVISLGKGDASTIDESSEDSEEEDQSEVGDISVEIQAKKVPTWKETIFEVSEPSSTDEEEQVLLNGEQNPLEIKSASEYLAESDAISLDSLIEIKDPDIFSSDDEFSDASKEHSKIDSINESVSEAANDLFQLNHNYCDEIILSIRHLWP